MKFELPPLPYAKDALEPYISRNTLDYHYDKHHRGYLHKLEEAISNTAAGDKSLEALIVDSTDQSTYNLAAQVWNHSFYWQSMNPNGGGEPPAKLKSLLAEHFGSLEAFRDQFSSAAAGCFGSGWAWLVYDHENRLQVLSTGNAQNPLSEGMTPILTLDVWEHAYYLDYQNDRAGYIETFFKHLINWDFVAANLRASSNR